jgi:hypothetical protein
MSRRTTIALIGFALLLVGAGLYFYGPQKESWLAFCGACVRVGAIMVALWLAFPQVSRVPGWLYGCTLAGLVVIAFRRWAILWVGPTLVALWLLRPRTPKQGGTSPAARTRTGSKPK